MLETRGFLMITPLERVVYFLVGGVLAIGFVIYLFARGDSPTTSENTVKCPDILDQITQLEQQGQRKLVAFAIGKPYTDVEVIFGDPKEGDWTRVIVHEDTSACIVESGRGLLLPTPE
jgi:hypothetical protein